MLDTGKIETLEFQPGTVIDGKYEILEVIGSGGMGTVYRAHHRFIRKDVALKMLNPQLSGSEQLVLRFEREAMASARLDHPNVCLVTDSGKAMGGQLYIVMELLQGRSLQKLVAEEAPLSIPRILGISKQVCSALCRAHEIGIVHRDLKPENVMLTRRGDGDEVVKIMDFGIAKVTIEDLPSTQLTTAGMVFGTPHYISPEQAAGDPIDGRSDLYSLGCMIYEMATGKRPFESDTMGGLLRKHVAGEIPEILPAGKIGPPQVRKLSDVVRRLMAKSPGERPSTAGEVYDLLEEIEKEEVPAALAAPPAAPVERKGGAALEGSIATAATLVAKRVEAEVPRIALIIKEIFLSLFMIRMEEARGKAGIFFDSILVPHALRIVAGARRSPALLVLWFLFVAAAVSGIAAGIAVVAVISSGEEERIQAGKNDKRRVTGKTEAPSDMEKAISLEREGKSEEALALLEALATNQEMESRPSFLFHLAIMRSKIGRHDGALDVVEKCVKVRRDCGNLHPIQDAIVAALRNKSTSKRASHFVARYGTGQAIRQVEKMAREDTKKWLRSAAYDALVEGKHLAKLDGWSRTAIEFVHGTGCKKKNDLLRKIGEEGNPGALAAIDLFSSRTGCGFFRIRDCYKCFRNEWEKTRSALLAAKEKKED